MSMTKDQLITKLRLVQIEYENKKTAVYNKYVDDNKLAKIGDTLTDGGTIILVDCVFFNLGGFTELSIYYGGKKLTKRFEPYKSGEYSYIHEYQPNFRIIKK